MSGILELADVLVAVLNAHDFALPFASTRRYVPIFDLDDLSGLHVTVVPRSIVNEDASRTTEFFDYTVDIGIQQQVKPSDTDTLDALMALVEEIGDYLRLSRLAGLASVGWVGFENDPIIVPEHLEQRHVFTSVLSVVYRARR